jgi:hypothetical protein
MPKHLAAAGAPPQDHIFDPLLPVTLPLPYEGHWGQIRAVYSMTALLDLYERWEAVVAEAQPAIDAATAAEAAAETPEARKAAQKAGAQASRDFSLQIIGQVMLRFEWPYQGNPPDPQDPASFARWPTAILSWLAGGALSEVRKRVEDPLSSTESAAS